ncbi:hypothetical protein [Vreelandella populi]|nr:hypothetical protein [Halomonas populi]
MPRNLLIAEIGVEGAKRLLWLRYVIELADQQARLKALFTSHPQMADATL